MPTVSCLHPYWNLLRGGALQKGSFVEKVSLMRHCICRTRLEAARQLECWVIQLKNQVAHLSGVLAWR